MCSGHILLQRGSEQQLIPADIRNPRATGDLGSVRLRSRVGDFQDLSLLRVNFSAGTRDARTVVTAEHGILLS